MLYTYGAFVKCCVQISCACYTAISHIGYTTCHLITRAHEHLNLNSNAKTAVKDYINSLIKLHEK